jgi:hypothetical protein
LSFVQGPQVNPTTPTSRSATSDPGAVYVHNTAVLECYLRNDVLGTLKGLLNSLAYCTVSFLFEGVCEGFSCAVRSDFAQHISGFFPLDRDPSFQNVYDRWNRRRPNDNE